MESVWDEGFVELFGRVLTGAATEPALMPAESMRMSRYYIAFLSHLENTYLQNRAGIVSDDVFESYGWRNRIWVSPHFLRVSEGILSVGVSPEFADFFKARTSELEPVRRREP